MTRVLLAAGVITMAAVGAARSSPITYNVNLPIGTGSVVGQIITDGKIGTLATGNILNWDLVLSAGGATTELTSAAGQSGVLISGADVTASASQLLFNYGGSDGGYFFFQASNPGFYSGQKYYCNNTSWYGCAAGASVVPQSYNSPSAQYDSSYHSQTVIGTGGPSITSDAVLESILQLYRARLGQAIVNQLQSQVLLGLNEQVSCDDCASAGMVFGSLSGMVHGRKALTDELTVFGGVKVGRYGGRSANVTRDLGFAASLQYDPISMGASRPYAAAGFSYGSQATTYERDYVTSVGPSLATGGTNGTTTSFYGQAGWVDRLSPIDEIAGNVTLSRVWQHTGGYTEQASDPFGAVVSPGTDVLDTFGVNAQYTRLLGSRFEADLNGGAEYAFHNHSGLNAAVGGAVPVTQANFVFYQIGGRLGIRVEQGLTVDLFVNGILAPGAIPSGAHGGFDVRFNL